MCDEQRRQNQPACFTEWSEKKLFIFLKTQPGNRYCTWYAKGNWKSNQLELKLTDYTRNEPGKRAIAPTTTKFDERN